MGWMDLLNDLGYLFIVYSDYQLHGFHQKKVPQAKKWVCKKKVTARTHWLTII
jgi:hypothetical protein